jgi:aldehyde:ferredoxin oxidoreductase
VKAVVNGYCGKILRANLTEKTTRVVPVAREMALGYIGGRGFASRMMYDDLKPGVDPLGADNNIYVLTGPINGTAVPYSSRYVVATKSPLTGTYTRSLSGGEFSAQLKYTGFDGIVIEGQSDKLVYLCLENGSAEIRDAGNLWGMTTRDTEENLRENLKGSKSLTIGPAGEQRVLFASVFNDWGRSAGGGGTGAVFGAKRLKAIVVRGQQGVRVPNKETFLELLRESYAAVKSHPGVPERIWKGTTMTVETTSKLGIIPVRNFSGGKLKGAENL